MTDFERRIHFSHVRPVKRRPRWGLYLAVVACVVFWAVVLGVML